MVNVVGFLLDYLVVAGVYALLSISMNIEYGWAGIPNFGKAAFVAAGGAAAAVVSAQIIPPLLLGHSRIVPGSLNFYREYSMILHAYSVHPWAAWAAFLLSAAIGAVVAIAIGVAFTYPAIRLREDYLAIALLMAAQLVWIVLRTVRQIMGGSISMVLPRLNFQDIVAKIAGPEPSPALVTAVKAGFVWLIVLAFFLYVERLMNSPFGRKLRAVRDDDIAAEAMGKDVPRARLEAMIVGSMLAGIAGAVYAFIYRGSVNPDNYVPDLTFLILTAVLVGGVGNNVGSVIGALVIAAIDYIGYSLGTRLSTLYGFSWADYIHYLIYGATIVAAIALRPQGLIPEKPVKTVAWRVYERVMGVSPPFLQNPLRKLFGGRRARRGGENA